eukprot:TRINITY_DN22142_c0_g1_i1.p1 TRINITY_DN22142_c0_g1~~TRINITY_DN22142_c0_g1_i1.p1  ORF type:complete len:1126 (-),score=311.38 TRINITY_DN22142_c0_g1_i1:91-3468(-)
MERTARPPTTPRPERLCSGGGSSRGDYARRPGTATLSRSSYTPKGDASTWTAEVVGALASRLPGGRQSVTQACKRCGSIFYPCMCDSKASASASHAAGVPGMRHLQAPRVVREAEMRRFEQERRLAVQSLHKAEVEPKGCGNLPLLHAFCENPNDNKTQLLVRSRAGDDDVILSADGMATKQFLWRESNYCIVQGEVRRFELQFSPKELEQLEACLDGDLCVRSDLLVGRIVNQVTTVQYKDEMDAEGDMLIGKYEGKWQVRHVREGGTAWRAGVCAGQRLLTLERKVLAEWCQSDIDKCLPRAFRTNKEKEGEVFYSSAEEGLYPCRMEINMLPPKAKAVSEVLYSDEKNVGTKLHRPYLKRRAVTAGSTPTVENKQLTHERLRELSARTPCDGMVTIAFEEKTYHAINLDNAADDIRHEQIVMRKGKWLGEGKLENRGVARRVMDYKLFKEWTVTSNIRPAQALYIFSKLEAHVRNEVRHFKEQADAMQKLIVSKCMRCVEIELELSTMYEQSTSSSNPGSSRKAEKALAVTDHTRLRLLKREQKETEDELQRVFAEVPDFFLRQMSAEQATVSEEGATLVSAITRSLFDENDGMLHQLREDCQKAVEEMLILRSEALAAAAAKYSDEEMEAFKAIVEDLVQEFWFTVETSEYERLKQSRYANYSDEAIKDLFNSLETRLLQDDKSVSTRIAGAIKLFVNKREKRKNGQGGDGESPARNLFRQSGSRPLSSKANTGGNTEEAMWRFFQEQLHIFVQGRKVSEQIDKNATTKKRDIFFKSADTNSKKVVMHELQGRGDSAKKTTDNTSDGKLTLHEFQTVLRQSGVPWLGLTGVKDLFEVMDSDRSGKIDAVEILMALTRLRLLLKRFKDFEERQRLHSEALAHEVAREEYLQALLWGDDLVGPMWDRRIPDCDITASSYFRNRVEFGANGHMWRLRMDNQDDCWKAGEVTVGEQADQPWVQWQFKHPRLVTAVVTAGHADTSFRIFVTEYKIRYSWHSSGELDEHWDWYVHGAWRREHGKEPTEQLLEHVQQEEQRKKEGNQQKMRQQKPEPEHKDLQAMMKLPGNEEYGGTHCNYLKVPLDGVLRVRLYPVDWSGRNNRIPSPPGLRATLIGFGAKHVAEEV